MADIKDRRPGGGGAFGDTVLYHDEGDGTYSEAHAAHLRGWDGSNWIRAAVDASGRLVTGHGKTLQFVAIAQGAAGTTQLVAAAGTGIKIKVVSYAFTLSANGTAKFTGTGDLTGAFDILASGGLVVVGQPNSHLFETGANAALSIVTTGGAAKGHLAYFTEA